MMKKNRFKFANGFKIGGIASSSLIATVCALSLFCVAIFTGCDDLNGLGKKQVAELKDVNYLALINPSDKTKKVLDSWTLEISKRSAEPLECDEPDLDDFEFIEHTRPFSDDDINLQFKTSRDESTPVKFTSYKKGNMHVFSGNSDTFLNGTNIATLKYEGEYCYIWTFNNEAADSKMTDEEIEIFAQKFDAIYVKETAMCGPTYQGNSVLQGVINPNKKVSVVLYDIGNDKNGGNIYGFFQPGMYYTGSNNAIEAIFIDSYYAKKEELTAGLFSTLAHEFNHLLNYANKTLKYGLSMTSWYTEMLSMVTEDFFLDDLGVNYSNSPHARLELFVKGGHKHGFKNWREADSSIMSYNYSNAFAFGAFLARNYGGAELIHEIATNEFVDEESVVKAVNKLNGTNYSFNDLLKKFTAILINSQNENSKLPSLNKEYSGSITGLDSQIHEFKLDTINLDSLRYGVDIKYDDLENIKTTALDSYGFLLFKFNKKTDLSLNIEEFLIYASY